MSAGNPTKKSTLKKILIVIGIGLVAAAAVALYIFTDTFDDTATQKAAYTVSANPFIKEFEKDNALANKKYTEQIITVNGRISEIEAADTTVNIKMIDTTTGSYIIFAFQQQDAAEAKKLKEGDSVSVKGSCSGGIFSEILEVESINFKRSSINK
jgi:flagellar basal body-associated protein FliL